MRKAVIFGLMLIFLICCCYVFFTIQTIRKVEEKIISPDGKYFLIISKESPLMSFGSGKTELRLYRSCYLYAGKCMFGEFPLRIEKWDIQNKEIFIKIRQHDVTNSSYIKQYTNKNTHIGKFNLFYQIAYENYVETGTIYMRGGRRINGL